MKANKEFKFIACSSCEAEFHSRCLTCWEMHTEYDSDEREICYDCHRDENKAFYEEYEKKHPTIPRNNDDSSVAGEAEHAATDETVRNRRGRPRGTTNAKKAAQKQAKIDGTNRVVVLYNELKAEAKRTRTTVPVGTRKRLVEEAKAHFKIKDEDFDVIKTLIQNRIDRGNLKVYQRGQVAPLATVEIVLIGYILSAARVGAPLSCGEVVLLMTTLIAGTIWEKLYIDYKKNKIFEPNGNLIGGGWLRGFFRRNGEIIESTQCT